MKKILRLFIPILCVLFALGSMPETVAALSGSFRGDSVLDSVLGSALDSVTKSFRFSSGPAGSPVRNFLQPVGNAAAGIAELALTAAKETAEQAENPAAEAPEEQDGTDRKQAKDVISYY